MSADKLTRRDFLRAAAMAAVGAVAASCAQPTAEVVQVEKVVKETVVVEKQVTPTPGKYKDPPALVGLVQAGQLDPIEERIGQEPLVLAPNQHGIGKYGGTLRTIEAGTSSSWLTNSGYEKMLRWSLDATEIEPNVVRQWEVTDEGKTWTLYLRKGMRWSDGEPFSADDVEFMFEDVWGNEEIYANYPKQVGGERIKFEKIDDYTVRLTTVAPWGFGAYYLAYFDEYLGAKHYLSQFMPKYADAAKLDAMVKAADFETWDQLFGNKNDWYYNRNPDLPVIKAWYPTSDPPTTLYVFKRNPYYWKVDPEGNQLPYIDEVKVNMVQDAEVLRLQILAGRSDLQERRIEFDVYPLLKENEEIGGYKVLLYDNPRGAVPAIMPNLNHNVEPLAELIRDDRFRKALSYAINREQINEIVWSGAAEPRQATIATMSPIFKPEYARAYADYAPDKANALLDEMGLTKRDADGYRLRPDGETIFLLIETPGEEPAELAQLELVAQHWGEVGIKAELQPSERGIFRNRVRSGDVSIGMWQLDYVYYPFQPTFSVPTNNAAYWAPMYGQWYATGGNEGAEPPPEIKALTDIWEELQAVTDPERQIALFQDVFDLHMKHCWLIGIVGHPPRPVLVNNTLRNYSEKGVYAWTIGQYFNAIRLEQLFYEG